jgi:Raf kinase inhibitor-like YbhB/YbcL family protein
MIQRCLSVVAGIMFVLAATGSAQQTGGLHQTVTAEGVKAMIVTSSDFSQGQMIPDRFSCQGDNVSPALSWSGVPAQAKSLALVVEDPDAPSGTFIHWIVVNLPPKIQGLAEGGPLPAGAQEITNSGGRKTYMGPCPPSGTHHYHFKLFALNVPALGNLNRKNYSMELKNHALAQADLVGLYQKKQ